MRIQTGSFPARGDDGSEYVVYVYTNYIKTDSPSVQNDRIEGARELQTASGLKLSRFKRGVYQIVETGVILRSTVEWAV